MYARILVPVDLGHVEALDKALSTAAQLAVQFGASVRYVGVTGPEPSDVAHSPAEFAAKLDAFAAEQGARRGIAAEAKAYTVHDPAAELDETLLRAAMEAEADLVVMASHVPRFLDLIFPSHGGSIAAKSPASVFVVR